MWITVIISEILHFVQIFSFWKFIFRSLNILRSQDLFSCIFFHSLIRKVESIVEIFSRNIVYSSFAQNESKVLRKSHCRSIILSGYNLDKTLSKLISTLNLHLHQHLSLVCNVGKSKPFVHWNMGVPSTLENQLQSQFQADKEGHCRKEIWINSNGEDTPNWSTHILYSGIVEVSQEAMWKHFSGLGILVYIPSPLAKCGLFRVVLISLYARQLPLLFSLSPRTNETNMFIHTWC